MTIGVYLDMHDHNLDDLIIDETVTQKNEKTKGILTILVLVVIVLVVAIILTKIILKEPKVDTIVEDNASEFIDPELTLEKKGDSPKEENKTVLDDSIDMNETYSIDEEDDDDIEAKQKNPLPKPVVEPDNVIKPPKESHKVEHTVEHRPNKKLNQKVSINNDFDQIHRTKVTPSRTHIVKHNQTHLKTVQKYYIQVGSFSQQPSDSFLGTIKNKGFNYTILSLSNGMKKLLIGPYQSRQAVDKALPKVRDRISKGAFVYKVK